MDCNFLKLKNNRAVKATKLVGLVTLILFLVSCSNAAEDAAKPQPQNKGNISTVSLTMESEAPADGSIDIPVNTAISVIFNQPIDFSTINSETFIVTNSNNNVDGTLDYSSENHTVTFSPNEPLLYFSNYTVTLSTNIADSSGVRLEREHSFSFKTVSEPVIPGTQFPTVSNRSPAINSTNIELNTTVNINFSEELDSSTINESNFYLTTGGNNVPGTVTYDPANNLAVFSPENLLLESKIYSVTLSASIKDLDGKSLVAENYIFETISIPKISAQQPMLDSTNVAVNSTIRVTFNEAMNSGTINESTFTLANSTGAVPGSVSYNPSTHVATFTPSANLRYFLDYNVTLSSSITDAVGTPITTQLWSFKTKKQKPWAKLYRGSRHEKIFDIQVLRDDNYIVVGETSSFSGGPYDAWISKVDVNGTPIWLKVIGAGSDELTDVLETGSGIVAIGFSSSTTEPWLIKFDSDGNIIWFKSIANAGIGSGLAVENGNFIVAGRMNGSAWVAKFNPDGDVLWQKSYGNSEYSLGKIIAAQDGGYIAIGKIASTTTNSDDGWVLKITANGSIAWQKTLYTPDHDWLNDIQITSDGNYVVVGWTDAIDFSDRDGWIVKLNVNGGVVWQKLIGFTLISFDSFRAIIKTPDNELLIAGELQYTAGSDLSIGNGYQGWLIKLNNSGVISWQKTFGGYNFDTFRTLKGARDGGFLTGGYAGSFQGGWLSAWLLKFDENGVINFHEAAGVTVDNTPPTMITSSNAATEITNVVATELTSITITDNPTVEIRNNVSMDIENISGSSGVVADPTNLTVVQEGVGQLRLNWTDNSNNETGYIILKSEDSINYSRAYIFPTSANVVQHIDSAFLTSGVTYYYKIIGYNRDGYSNFSNVGIGVPP